MDCSAPSSDAIQSTPPPSGSNMSQETSLSDAQGTPASTPGYCTDSNSQEVKRKKGGWPKGKKRKPRIRDVNAPRQPLTGYVRYLNENRERVRSENPSASFSDVTKLLAVEWSKLTVQEKQKYLDEAEKDRERYLKELEEYQRTEAYKIFSTKQQEKKKRNYDDDSGGMYNGSMLEMAGDEFGKDDVEMGGFEVPIFTEEFLDHNKVREAELRQLRKSNTEYEEQNAILSKHVDNIKSAIEKLEVETVQQRNNNMALQQHLENLRKTLTARFASVPLPGTHEVPTVDTIDSYMSRMHSIILDSPQENETLISTVREIVSRLDYQC